MEQGNKKDAPVAAAAGDDHEIDRIMKEIEDLEQKVEEPAASSQTAESVPDNVVPLRGSNTYTGATQMAESSMVESDAVPVADEPFMKDDNATGENGNLSLKIGGCATVSLEFERAGLVVSFECTETGLTITTDQGAEFRIPFTSKQAA